LHANLRGYSDIFMVEATDALQLDYLPLLWQLDWPAVRRIFP